MNTEEFKDELIGVCNQAANILDERIPNWFKRINLEKLDMGSLTKCLIGQLADKNYTFLFDDLKVYENNIGSAFDVAYHQINQISTEEKIREREERIKTLTEIWTDLIKERTN